MKFNELIKPAGIGRKQLAFNTGNIPNPLFAAETALNDAENTTPYIDAAVSVSGLSEAAAYSAATATQNAVENFVYEADQITNFSWIPTSGNPEIRIPFARPTIKSPYITYDARLNRFSLRKPGWYLINTWFFFDGANGNYDWWLSFAPENINIIPGGVYETYPRYMDYHNVYKHPSLKGSAIFNVPAQIDGSLSQGERSFGINLGTTFGGAKTHTNTNTKIGIQIIYLGALTMSERVINYTA